jgi:lambda family phage portal protein
MADLKDINDFKEAHLISEQVAACFSAFIESGDPDAIATGARGSDLLEEISPATIQYLGPGQKIQFASPVRPGDTLGPYMEWILRGVAAAIRYPFELLCKKFENNFSGGRLSLIDGRVTFRAWQAATIEECWERVYRRFVDECVMVGAVEIPPELYIEHKSVFQRHAHIPPGWPWVDPVKDVKSDTDAIAANLGTEAESCASRGSDWEETKHQRLREKLMDVEVEAAVRKRRIALGLPPEPVSDAAPAAAAKPRAMDPEDDEEEDDAPGPPENAADEEDAYAEAAA